MGFIVQEHEDVQRWFKSNLTLSGCLIVLQHVVGGLALAGHLQQVRKIWVTPCAVQGLVWPALPHMHSWSPWYPGCAWRHTCPSSSSSHQCCYAYRQCWRGNTRTETFFSQNCRGTWGWQSKQLMTRTVWSRRPGLGAATEFMKVGGQAKQLGCVLLHHHQCEFAALVHFAFCPKEHFHYLLGDKGTGFAPIKWL